ncbi:uncharacterized protein LOC130115255 [Lampris incognitus]|uniref:uncharacterized protein LOC130115255 n=1 Tax=Lampris incognitus TaxID=2546036 RepID=UPI0024B62E3A|nr:uncharacterized protein LOC130115255 [Lampris incognitus]
MMDQPITEICLKFERRIADYEAEILRLKEENSRQRKLLDAIYKPEVRIYKSDLQQFLVSEDKVPSVKQEWSPILDQGEPKPPHIKEEEEQLWSSQEEEQLEGLEEKADITELSFPPVPVRRENDTERAQSSQLHQSQTEEKREAELPASTLTEQMKPETDGEDFGPIEPASNLNQDCNLQPTSDGYLSSDCCESETEDNDDDLQQFFVSEDKVPSVKQEWSPSLDQGEPEPPHIKEEEEKLWSSQEEEQLEGLEKKADITELSFPPVPTVVKVRLKTVMMVETRLKNLTQVWTQ